MKISVFGLGYVGGVMAGCLVSRGHEVLGVDINRHKADALRKGCTPVPEPGLAELIAEGVRENRLRVCESVGAAVEQTDVSIVCVGTPSRPSGVVDLRYVSRALAEIADAIASKRRRHLVVLRSTVPPGTTRRFRTDMVARCAPDLFALVFNPEFLREGHAVKDFQNAAIAVIGTEGSERSDELRFLVAESSELMVCDYESAEMIKYACNAFHAMKVAFANELGRAAQACGADGSLVMRALCADRTLNISPAYLQPGFAYGGSCLPKDLRALIADARLRGVDMPLLDGVARSNTAHLAECVRLVRSKFEQLPVGLGKILVSGITFKPGTDDLRESPAVELVERLMVDGMPVTVFDPNVHVADLVGRNRLFVDQQIPDLPALLTNHPERFVNAHTVVVYCHGRRRFPELASIATACGALEIDLGEPFSAFSVRR